jgi:DNA-binding MarR family transcriptional regulator
MRPMMASRAIRQLERRGWVARKLRADDKRSYTVSLTPKGQAAYRGVGGGASRRYREVVACLSRRELDALDAALQRLIAHTRRLV